MKTAISIPDELYRRLEAARKRKKLSRSEALQGALVNWLKHHDGENITVAINAAIEQLGDDAQLDPEVEAAGLSVLAREHW